MAVVQRHYILPQIINWGKNSSAEPVLTPVLNWTADAKSQHWPSGKESLMDGSWGTICPTETDDKLPKSNMVSCLQY